MARKTTDHNPQGRNSKTGADQRELLAQLTTELKVLRIAYEKYFTGVEKREPLRQRDAFKKRVRILRSRPSPNTATRFKVEQLLASFVSHESHWNRIVRRIEEGTYRRGAGRGSVKPAPAKTPDPPTSRSPEKASTHTPRPEVLAALHRDLVSAQTQAGLQAVSIEALERTVNKQRAAIIAQYKCKDVEFRIGMKNGKPILKAVTKN